MSHVLRRGCCQEMFQRSGRKPEQVTDLIGRFGMMHNMMANLVAQPGLLGQLPGFKQMSQMRQMKGMGMFCLLGQY